MSKNVLVTGAGGFIGGHLVRRLLDEDHTVVAVDVKPRDDWQRLHVDALNFDLLDVDEQHQLGIIASVAGTSFDEVYNLAADMGGIGFIETHKARCMLSVLTTTNVLRGALTHGWSRVFYSSSACVYPVHLQREADVVALREQDAYPADPEDGYGWEKLFGERMHRHFTEDFGVETRVARYHNVYGPHGAWRGGREKAPAALCRKIAEVALGVVEPRIQVWGDGEQTRSFTYVDDAIEGTIRLMRSDVREPLNIGSSELVTINRLVTLLEEVAEVHVERVYDVVAPMGVRGRNSDNALIRQYLDWEPSIALRDGITATYEWVYGEVARTLELREAAT